MQEGEYAKFMKPKLSVFDYKLICFSTVITIFSSLLFLLFYGLRAEVLIAIFYIAVFAPAAIIDYRKKIIPNFLIISGYIAGLIMLALYAAFGWGFNVSIPDRIIGSLLVPFILFLIDAILEAIFKKQCFIGMGDIKALSIIGLTVGWKYQYMLLALTLIISGIVGLITAIRMKTWKFSQPMGPYMYIGLLIVLSVIGIS